MSIVAWHYVRSPSGSFERVPKTRWRNFIEERGPLGSDGSTFVETATIAVDLMDRRAVRVEHKRFDRLPLKSDGTFDLYKAQCRDIVPNASSDLFSFGLSGDADGLIDASHIFAYRRARAQLTWHPTEDDIARLRILVNRRAGREIL